MKMLTVLIPTVIVVISGCQSCNNCGEGNLDSKLVLLVNLPQDNGQGCTYDLYPYHQMLAFGVPPCCLFTKDLYDQTEHYIELDVSGECFNGEFNTRYRGVFSEGILGNNCPNYILGGGCFNDGGANSIQIEPHSIPNVLKLCVTIPWSQHHGHIEFNISLLYRTMCTKSDENCQSCGAEKYFYAYYKHDGIYNYQDPEGGVWELCEPMDTYVYYVDVNSFDELFIGCESSGTCKP